jgi:parallel beta-helix repeat protein
MIASLVLGLMIISQLVFLLALTLDVAEAADDFLTPHDPIVIEGDSDFKPANGVIGGSGTESDPYIIDGWDIWSDPIAIDIRNTTAHFVIHNVSITGTVNDGIVLRWVTNGTVDWVDIYTGDDGVLIYESSNITVTGCSISELTNCVRVNGSADCAVYSNSLISGSSCIRLESSDNVDIYWNSVNAFNDGIVVTGPCASGIRMNNVSCSTGRGIVLDDASGCSVENNSIGLWHVSGTGIVADGAANATIANNTIGDYDGVYYDVCSGVFVLYSEYMQVTGNKLENLSIGICVNESAYCSVLNNTIISTDRALENWLGMDNQFSGNTATGATSGLRDFDSSLTTAMNNTLEATDTVIQLTGCTGDYIVGNLVNGTDPEATIGVEVSLCSWSEVDENRVTTTLTGIDIHDCEWITVAFNTVSSMQEVIIVDASTDVYILNNTLDDGDCGVELYASTHIYVWENIITPSKWIWWPAAGVSAEQCSNLDIFGNKLVGGTEVGNCSLYGILLMYCEDSFVYSNSLSYFESGLGIDMSTGITAFWNDFSYCMLTLFDAPYNLICNNTFNEMSELRVTYACQGSELTGNVFAEESRIGLESTTEILIMANTFERGGVAIWGGALEHFESHVITEDNTVGGYPIYMVTGAYGAELSDVRVGELIVVNCSACIIGDVDVRNSTIGILLAYVDGTLMVGSNIANCNIGVYMAACSDLVFYHNSFLWNTDHIWGIGTGTVYLCIDYPNGGNYWSDYTGVDEYSGESQDVPGADGIGDTWYEGVWWGVDYYPLMSPSDNAPPSVVMDVSQTEGDLETVFEFDASTTWDLENDSFEYRWDFDGDGTWDTDWSWDPTAAFQFDEAGEYNVTVEVRDGGGATGTDTVTVTVEGTVIPEFSTAFLPVAAILGLMLLMRLARARERRRGEKT